MAYYARLGILFFLLFGCKEQYDKTIITVREPIGLDRTSELVTTTVDVEDTLGENDILVATDMQTSSIRPVQVLDTLKDDNNTRFTIMFPVTIGAKESKEYSIDIQEKMRDFSPVQLNLSQDKMSLQNRYFDILFSERDARGGQIDGIFLKDFNGQLLKRGHISMHWAPNFSKSGSDNYFNMENLPLTSEHSVSKEYYRIVKSRSGVTDSVPEISVESTYLFFADLPYFLFESTMTMQQDVKLNLLRNDEMTMDSLFTHVMYAKKDGTVGRHNLYNDELEILDAKPIPDDAPWVAFYNEDKEYGFGSIRLAYDNTDLGGNTSPTLDPYTKISRATRAGRYWNRVFLEEDLIVPKGSRYHEKNAYLVFRASKEGPEKEIQEYYRKLTSPLQVAVLQ